MKNFRLSVIFAFFLLLLSLVCARFYLKQALQTTPETHVIVIDVGHGGFDPGKISADQILEKDINLAIALRLKAYLAAMDCQVYMTRDEDCSLADADASNKKQSDMRNRVAMVEQIQPDLMVSIHQNSFSSAEEHGAQTFYYHTSEASQMLAADIQASLIASVDPDNSRQEKSNDSYYVLKNVSCPAVIVECGFLSNPSEAALLNTAAYQDQIAYAIAKGVRAFLNTADAPNEASADI